MTHRYFEIAFLNFAKFLLDLLTDLKIVSNGHELLDVDIRLLQSNIVRSVRLFVWFAYFISYNNSTCKVNNISCKNIIL